MKMLAAVLLLTILVNPCRAQTAAVADPLAISTSSWIKIGGPWGPGQAWQLGFDASPTAGACGFYNAAGKNFIVGVCRDLLIAAHNKRPAMHLGFQFGYDVLDTNKSKPYYLGRFGLSVGPALRNSLTALTDKIPYLDSLSSFKAPAWAQYLGDIASVDAGGGPGVGHKPAWGGGLKVDIPLGDLAALISSVGGQ